MSYYETVTFENAWSKVNQHTCILKLHIEKMHVDVNAVKFCPIRVCRKSDIIIKTNSYKAPSIVHQK